MLALAVLALAPMTLSAPLPSTDGSKCKLSKAQIAELRESGFQFFLPNYVPKEIAKAEVAADTEFYANEPDPKLRKIFFSGSIHLSDKSGKKWITFQYASDGLGWVPMSDDLQVKTKYRKVRAKGFATAELEYTLSGVVQCEVEWTELPGSNYPRNVSLLSKGFSVQEVVRTWESLARLK